MLFVAPEIQCKKEGEKLALDPCGAAGELYGPESAYKRPVAKAFTV